MRDTSRPHDPARAGFTLIEVLITLIIASFLITAMFAGLHSLQRSWTVLRFRDGSDDAEAAVAIATRWLAQSVDINKRGADGVDRSAFEGRADGVEFVTLGQGGILPTGLVDVRVQVVEKEGRRQLSVGWSFFRSASSHPAERSFVLLDHVDSMRLEYLSNDASASDPDWQARWADQPGIPAAVRISISREKTVSESSVALSAAVHQ